MRRSRGKGAQGNVTVLHSSAVQQAATFGPLQGTYLLLEKLRYAVFRRLLRKVHAVHGALEPEKRAQIPLAQFQAALAMQVAPALTAFPASTLYAVAAWPPGVVHMLVVPYARQPTCRTCITYIPLVA